MKREIVIHGGIEFIRFPDSKSKSAARYFYPFANGRRVAGVGALHRVVWAEANGPIPKGHHVHHIDEDWSNNSPDNLECVTHAEHMRRHHSSSPAQREAFRTIVQPKAAEWHGSEAGRKWHSEHGKQTWVGREPIQIVCKECGKTYHSLAAHGEFCTLACGLRWRYKQWIYFVVKNCEHCGKEFKARRERNRFCSKTCSARARHPARNL